MSARDELFRRVAGAFINEAKANALLDAYRAEVLAEAQVRLDETFRLAPLSERAEGINFAIGVLMSMRGESRA
ncbi:hypothetical protein ADK53_30500 [Streptomyces sp. WM6373]|uniref:hypothetical protein n=1 Tax=Streptomyces sp. WM6373 TaxID=1415556 RepID=UPI0006ADCD0C|nr:hypothetical protein [Streptomyces sp. WM6373]KOU29999.1 hypothetical protein ADK53_30500 [Streptomyces sp. WM6373]